MPEKTQAKTYKEKFDSLLDDMIRNGVTKSEVKQVIDTFAQKVNELNAMVREKMAENKSEMSIETARLGKEMAAMEKRLRSLTTDTSGDLKKEFDTFRNEMSANMGYIESLIEYYDDSEVRDLIQEVRDSIPTEFDPSDIVDQVDRNTEEIEELKKRPVTITSGGSGTGFKNVELLAKYFIKKETPSGTFDGANTDFTVTKPIFAVLGFALNSRVIHFDNYTVKDKTISFDTAPSADYANKKFEITYI